MSRLERADGSGTTGIWKVTAALSLIWKVPRNWPGFRATGGTGGTFDYLVDIGQASLFRDATVSFTLTGLGDIKSDLDFLFGATWITRPDVLWSISGTPGATAAGGDPLRTLYATRPETVVGVQSIPWTRSNSAGQSTATNKLAAVGGGYVQNGATPNSSTANSPVGVFQNTSDVNSYASFQLGGTNTSIGTAYSYFNNGIEGNFGTGTAGTALDLYRVLFAGGANGGSIGNPRKRSPAL